VLAHNRLSNNAGEGRPKKDLEEKRCSWNVKNPAASGRAKQDEKVNYGAPYKIIEINKNLDEEKDIDDRGGGRRRH